MLICDQGLRDYFVIPANCSEIAVVVSEEKDETSYRYLPPYDISPYLDGAEDEDCGCFTQLRMASGKFEVVAITPSLASWLEDNGECRYIRVEITQ